MLALTRRAALVAAALGLLTTSSLATDGRADSALADGKADGTLTVNGKTTKVAFAYARPVPGFFDKNTKDIQVIVSDVPLDAKALADDFLRASMAKEGKLHAFEITIDAAGTPVSTAWRRRLQSPTPSGLSSDDVFTKKVLDGKLVEGSYKSAADRGILRQHLCLRRNFPGGHRTMSGRDAICQALRCILYPRQGHDREQACSAATSAAAHHDAGRVVGI